MTLYRVDSTGASAATINLPPSGTAVDGQPVRIALVGATAAAGVIINPGTGNNMIDPNNPGQFVGVGTTGTTFRAVGAIFGLRYQLVGPTGATGPSWLQEV